MFDLPTMADTAHIDTIFKFLPHARQHAQNWPEPVQRHLQRLMGDHEWSCLQAGPLRTSHQMHVAQQPQTHSCVIPTHRTTSPPERPFSHYIHSHRLAAEMWTTTKNKLLGGKNFSCSFYLYRFRKYVSYGFPIIMFCNPGVHYATPCILKKCFYLLICFYTYSIILTCTSFTLLILLTHYLLICYIYSFIWLYLYFFIVVFIYLSVRKLSRGGEHWR